MRDHYTPDEATKDSFLFISYSHDDREAVTGWIDYLIDQGVRVFWDKAFSGSDDWETIAKTLLSHKNCCGILFFGSKSSIQSKNVAKEWRTAAKTKQNRCENTFYSQIIMVNGDDGLDYKYLTNFVKKNEKHFSDDDFDDFRDLFGKKNHIFYTATDEQDKQKLLQNIKERVPQTVDEHEIAREKLSDLSKSGKDVILRFGTYGTDRRPISWRNMSDEGNECILLCQEVLGESEGGQKLNDWFKSFIRQSFSSNEQSELQGKVRLLKTEEAERLTQEELSTKKIWWLEETTGHLQSVVREDGTIYKNGYNNKLYKKGVRPVIAIDSVVLFSILNNNF